MKKHFSCRPLLIIVCLLILFKFCAILASVLSMANLLFGLEIFLEWLATPSCLYLIFVAICVENGTLALSLLALLAVLFFAQLIPLLLLALNRKGAGASSIALLIYCIPDLCTFLLYSVSIHTFIFGALYNLAVIALLIHLRRSRYIFPTIPTNNPPAV